MGKYVLKIYTTDKATSKSAIRNLQAICDAELPGRYEITVINVQENPELAEIEKILVTPTLIRELPEPVRRIIGDLSDKEKVLVGLDLRDI